MVWVPSGCKESLVFECGWVPSGDVCWYSCVITIDLGGIGELDQLNYRTGAHPLPANDWTSNIKTPCKNTVDPKSSLCVYGLCNHFGDIFRMMLWLNG